MHADGIESYCRESEDCTDNGGKAAIGALSHTHYNVHENSIVCLLHNCFGLFHVLNSLAVNKQTTPAPCPTNIEDARFGDQHKCYWLTSETTGLLDHYGWGATQIEYSLSCQGLYNTV